MTYGATVFNGAKPIKMAENAQRKSKNVKSLLKCSSLSSSLGRRRNGLWLDDEEMETHKKRAGGQLRCSVSEPCCSDLAHK